jgi:hypothetical protein
VEMMALMEAALKSARNEGTVEAIETSPAG